MKRHIFCVAIGVLLAFLLLAGQAVAQNLDLNAYAYTIPFGFRAGTVNLPAGEYVVKIISAKGVICVENSKGDARAMFLATPYEQTRKPLTSRLVFNQYGNSHFLAKVWSGADSTGFQLPRSGAEKEFVRQASIPMVIEIALSRK
jgi:hypothetical protein